MENENEVCALDALRATEAYAYVATEIEAIVAASNEYCPHLIAIRTGLRALPAIEAQDEAE